jgi:hypothetical protein
VHFHIGFMEFLVFALYYVILKAILQIINIETRRNGWHVPAAVSGLYN